MDCRTVLDLLELPAPADPVDEADLRRAEALSHVAECPTCAATRGLRERFDRRIGRTLRDVPLPAGLRNDLLAALAAAETDVPESAADGVPVANGAPVAVAEAVATIPTADRLVPVATAPAGRRRWLRTLIVGASVLAAAGVLGAIGWWRIRDAAEPVVDLAEVRRELAARFDELPQAETAGLAETIPLPTYAWPSRAVAFDPTARAWTRPEGRTLGTVYRFEIREPGRAPVSAAILALPADRVLPLPAARHLAATGTEYVMTAEARFATAAWQDGDVVYVCLVRSGGDTLDRLRRALESIPT